MGLWGKVDKIYGEIETGISNLKHKTGEELDFSKHYDEMRSILKNIIYSDKTELGRPKVQYILLAFSLEIFNSPKYYESFWNTVYAELETNQNAYRIIFDTLFTLLENRLNIRVKRSGRSRLLVYTLRGKAEKDYLLLKASYDFFVTYFIYHRPEIITEQDQLTDDIEAVYIASRLYYRSEQKEFIINFTEDSTKAFYTIIENHTEKFENEEFLRRYLTDRDVPLGPFRGQRMTTVLRTLLNRLTPHQFKKELQKQIDATVLLPDGTQQKSRFIQNKTVDYGLYVLNGSRYRVTPNYRIGLGEMKEWRQGTVVEYKGLTYYKALKPFNVDGQEVRHFIDGNDRYYIWCGSLPIGREIVINGNRIKKEGFVWTPKLRMMWGRQGEPPTLQIETGHMVCNFSNYADKELTIRIGKSEYRRWLNHGGFLSDSIQDVISAPMSHIEVVASVNNLNLRKASFSLEEQMLFSGSTRERVQSQREGSRSVTRTFGESTYYLFSRNSPEQLKRKLPEMQARALDGQDKNIEILPMNWTSAGYYAYQVNWLGEAEFHLSIGEYEWKFTSKRYINVFFDDNIGVFGSIEDLVLFIETNISGDSSITYQIFDDNYEAITDKVPIRSATIYQNIYRLLGREILEDVLDDYLLPGNYIIELRFEDLYVQCSFYIIPPLSVQWPEVIPESEWTNISVRSNTTCLKQPKVCEATDNIAVSVIGRVWENRRDRRYDAEDISLRVSLIQPQLTKELSPPHKIAVFGFRLFLRDDGGISRTCVSPDALRAVKEFDYYNLANAEIHLFSRPGDQIRFVIHDKEIFKGKVPEVGTLVLGTLQFLSRSCLTAITKVTLKSSFGYEKSFEIPWHPRVFLLQGTLNSVDWSITSTIKYIGPEGSRIALKLSDPARTLEELQLVCDGSFREDTVHVSCKRNTAAPYYYLQTYTESVQDSFVPACSATLSNYLTALVTISLGREREKSQTLSVQRLMEDLQIEEYTRNMLTYDGPIWISFHIRGYSPESLRKLYTFFSQHINGAVIVPTQEHALHYGTKPGEEINNSQPLALRDARGTTINQVDVIANPIQMKNIANQGLGISSSLVTDSGNPVQSAERAIQKYAPRPKHLVILEAQALENTEREQLLSICQDRTLIFIERGKLY